MKQTIFTLLLLSAIGLVSCRKHDNQPNIKQFDQEQIQNYISANGITGMKKDTVGGDTSGIYYKIILQPKTDTALTYSDNISFVFTIKSFDGHYISSDTIENHYQGYVGHIVNDALPAGLEIAVLNDLKYVGASMRVLIPSHLAYGVNGYGSGSITNTSSRISGNQCLDYYVHVIASQPDNAKRQATYDYQVIKNYIAASGLTYTLDSAGVYYRIVKQGTGTDPITDNSTIEFNAYGRLLNNVSFDSIVPPDSTSLGIPDFPETGIPIMLKKYAVQGTTISMIMPSYLAYGTSAQTGVPANSPVRFEFTIQSVSP